MITEIRKVLEAMHEGALVEIRALEVPKNGRSITVGGYFRDYGKAAEAVRELEQSKPMGIYVNLNTIHPGCYARSSDRLTVNPKTLTSDRDIIKRRWILIDVDPIRPSGISSTEPELQQAIIVRDRIRRAIVRENLFTEDKLLSAMSGNGAHLLLPWSESWTDPEIEILASWAEVAHSSAQASVDQSVNKLAQIVRLYGTTARKGDDIPERSHRRSYLEGERAT